MEKERIFWTQAEDNALAVAVKNSKILNWRKIALNFKNKSIRDCRERWNKLQRKESYKWTKEEDKLLLEKVEKLGKQWKKISKFFTNKSDNNVRYRWNYLQQKEKNINVQQTKTSEINIDSNEIQNQKNENILNAILQDDVEYLIYDINRSEIERLCYIVDHPEDMPVFFEGCQDKPLDYRLFDLDFSKDNAITATNSNDNKDKTALNSDYLNLLGATNSFSDQQKNIDFGDFGK